jgi:outer membrane protein assembly factor BamB
MFAVRRSFQICLAVSCVVLTAADWPAFRGPHTNGVSDERGLPVHWSATENVVWKAKLPGYGTSSPIVSGGRVFVTCHTGHGIVKGGKVDDLRRHLLCVDRKTGAILWQATVPPKLPETPFNNYHAEHGYASSTPATDGKRVFVFFGRTGVLAFDFQGKQLWHVEVGTALNSWGSASSPILYKNLVLVNASVERNALIALDRDSGKEVWRARGIDDSWSTPLLVEVPGGKTEVVLHVQGALLAFAPDTGAKLWECTGVNSANGSSTPVARDGIVYVIGAATTGGRNSLAVRAGGKGDVTETRVVWKQKAGANHCSPVLYGDYLYWINGQVWCLRADTGAIVFQERLYDGRNEYSSPVAADGKLYAFTRRSGAYVLAANGKFELLSRNDLGDASVFNASPAVSDGQLFIRSNEYLYCLGKKD